jgi:RNA polymerase sigma factor for flagellar operon FliA
MTNALDISERNRLVEECQGLVRHLAQQVRSRTPAWVESDDLISYGQIGLMQAARDFDPAKGVKFSTFAFYRIRGAIFDGVNKLTWFRASREPEVKYNQMADSLIQAATASSPTAPASTADLTQEASWFSQIAGSLAVVYITAMDADSGTAEVVDDSVKAPWSDMVKHETSCKLQEAMKELPSDAAALVRAVYYEDRTLQEAADRLGISKSWASRLHAKALEQMARHLRQSDPG